MEIELSFVIAIKHWKKMLLTYNSVNRVVNVLKHCLKQCFITI